MTLAKSLQAAAGNAGGEATYVDDVFSTWLYTANNQSPQTITNGIDLATEGGLVWIKTRSAPYEHFLADTVRGASKYLQSQSTAAQITNATELTSFNTNGFSVGTDSSGIVNFGSTTLASWTFRKAEKFFDIVTYSGNGSNSRAIAHNLGATPGFIIVKRTDTDPGGDAASWAVWHRSAAGSGYLNRTNSLDSSFPNSIFWGGTSYVPPTSTTFTVSNSQTVNASGGTYVAYLFAHNAGGFGADGSKNVISCGSYTTDGSGNAIVNLGYEPQWILIKNSIVPEDWYVNDIMRGLPIPAANKYLIPNTSAAEGTGGAIAPTSTGFSITGLSSTKTYIYIAIRRPMKPPTAGTEVFVPVAVSSATSTGTQISNSFVVDTAIATWRDGIVERGVNDRLRGISTTNPAGSGNPFLKTNTTGAETTPSNVIYQGDGKAAMLGRYFAGQGYNQIYWLFGRASGFFDVVCYTGTGVARTVNHNLTVAPEFMAVKERNGVNSWYCYAASEGATKGRGWNSSNAFLTSSSLWNDTSPTSSVFTVGTASATNGSGQNFVAYLWATLPGISKVGSYTGTGTTLQVNCGFTSGARFVMIKRADDVGDWYVWDSARGIVPTSEPYLLLNSTAAEVYADYIDPYSPGFQVSSLAPAGLNASGGTYVFLAIS